MMRISTCLGLLSRTVPAIEVPECVIVVIQVDDSQVGHRSGMCSSLGGGLGNVADGLLDAGQ